MVTQKHYDNWTKSIVVPPGIRPRKMPARRGIRTQKWSNPPLCPVGGRWGMTYSQISVELVWFEGILKNFLAPPIQKRLTPLYNL